MGIFIFFLGCAIIGGAISGFRGRGQILGFVLGALIGPIGVLIALLLPLPIAEVERRQIASGEMDMCPFCSELIRPTALVCRHCGRDVPVSSVPPPPKAEVDRPMVLAMVGILAMLVLVLVLMKSTGVL